MNSNNLIFIVLAIAIFAVGGFLIYKNGPVFLESMIALNSTKQINAENLAQCLSAKGVRIYGAEWCADCEIQKRAFEKSWGQLDYVDCSEEGSPIIAAKCRSEHIRTLPTWVFADNMRKEGEFTLKEIANFSGCIGG